MGRKRKHYTKIILTFLLFTPFLLQATNIKYEDYIYNDSIKTVLLYQVGNPLSYPIIRLNSQDKLKLSFDDLTGNVKNYAVKFIHCDENWQPSNIPTMDYMNNFEFDNITDYDYSYNTLQYYVHYNYIFPNDNIKFLISGNYILYVYNTDDEDDIILSKRFVITEDIVGVSVKIKAPELPLYRKTHQELYIDIDISGLGECNDPAHEIKLCILQNNRWELAHKDIAPYSIENHKLIYRYDDKLLFKGSNEFRYFNTKTTRFLSQHIANIRYFDNHYHFYLYADPVKKYKQYLYEKDLNGKYKVDVEMKNNPELEADYVYVHFYLPYDYPLNTGDLYISGALTNWEYNNKNKLLYDYKNKAYYTDLYLKQGFYNYHYTFVDKKTGKADDSLIEGTYNDTENDYLVYVYFHKVGSRYTRVVAVRKANSLNQK